MAVCLISSHCRSDGPREEQPEESFQIIAGAD